MNQHEESEFARLCALMGEAFGKSMSASLIEVYFRALQDFNIQQVTSAVEQAIATKKFFPKVAELRELIQGNPEDRAAHAWAALLEATANGGQASVQFSDRATALAMDAVFGSWPEACRLLSAGGTDARGKQVGGCSDEMLASYQKSFLRQYGASLNSVREVELYRAGLSELSMRQQGASWAARMPVLEQPVLFIGPDGVIELHLRFDVAQGRLTEQARALLESGYEWVQKAASLQAIQAAPRPGLPPADAEMATPEEVKELKSRISALTKPTRGEGA